MKLSIVDISQVPTGGSAVEAFANTVDLAQHADGWGYARYWVAEHHGAATTNAGSNPEVLIAHLAARTRRIRIGSGAVLLNHYSPFKVAETFKVLHSLTPDRIDLGLGRANGRPVADFALQRDRRSLQRFDDHDQQVAEVLAWLYGTFPGDHPFAEVTLAAGVPGNPEPWLLGSSHASALLAGQLGMRYCFAGFINPRGAARAAAIYRDEFQPSTLHDGPAEPYVMLGMNVSVAETEREAARVRASVEAFYARLRSGEFRREPLPEPDAAVAELGGLPEPSEVRPGAWPQHISGSPEQVCDMLAVMAGDLGADEVILQDMIARHEDRLRSYELLAKAAGLTA